jgi:hypothetical protein
MAAKTRAKLEIRIKNSTFIAATVIKETARGLPGYRPGGL